MSLDLHENFDGATLRQAFACFPTGVMAFCGLVDGEPQGIAASSFTSVSLEPPLVSVCVARTSSTWPKLAALDRLGLSVLSNQHGRVARQLAAPGSERFKEVAWHASDGGAVFLRGASLWLDCRPSQVLPAGDHYLVLLEVVSLAVAPEVSPIVFHRSTFWDIAATP